MPRPLQYHLPCRAGIVCLCPYSEMISFCRSLQHFTTSRLITTYRSACLRKLSTLGQIVLLGNIHRMACCMQRQHLWVSTKTLLLAWRRPHMRRSSGMSGRQVEACPGCAGGGSMTAAGLASLRRVSGSASCPATAPWYLRSLKQDSFVLTQTPINSKMEVHLNALWEQRLPWQIGDTIDQRSRPFFTTRDSI